MAQARLFEKVKEDRLTSQCFYRQWFATEADALEAIKEFEIKSGRKFGQKCFTELPLAKCRNIQWDSINIPYVIVERAEFTPSTKGGFKFSGKISKPGNIHLAKAVKFPDFQISNEVTSDYEKLKIRPVLRARLTGTNSSQMSKKIEYTVTFPEVEQLQLHNTTRKETDAGEAVHENKNYEDISKSFNVKWFSSWEDATRSIEEFERKTTTKFIKGKKRKAGGSKSRIHWDEASGVPFAITCTHYWECQHGRDDNKARNDKKRRLTQSHLMDHPSGSRRNVLIQGTKKCNCHATLILTETFKFPQYVLAPENILLQKSKASKAINEALSKDENCITKEYACLVKFPHDKQHSGHAIAENGGILQRIDDKLIQKIHDLVADGVCSISEIKRGLHTYVKHVLFKDSEMPHESNRRYHPTNKDIQNHFFMAYTKHKVSKMDQENLHAFVEEWKQHCGQHDNIFFRPYISGDDNSIVTTSDGTVVMQGSQKLLFVHQMSWQRRLLHLYGQGICLLDATYKASKYALPLFFLCVKTNVGYQVVGTFIIQNEQTSDIAEALSMIKSWSQDWSPPFFMTDKSEAEIKAIESVFTNCSVLLCDFHREQAWERWVKRSDNGVGDSRAIVLAHLRKLAKSSSERSFTEALNDFRTSDCWISNPKLQKYFENAWLPEKQRWVRFYRANKWSITFHTNNGVERQNRTLKESYIRTRRDKCLSALALLLHKDFLPDNKRRYEQQNLFSSEFYRQYNSSIPHYLHNRPKKVVRHSLERIASSDEINCTSISQDGDVFLVKSASSELIYRVTFGGRSTIPNCSCEDFQRHLLPCKHMFAIIRHVPHISWETFPAWYVDSAFIVLDSHVVDNLAVRPGYPSDSIKVCDSSCFASNTHLEDICQDTPGPSNIPTNAKLNTIKEMRTAVNRMFNAVYDVEEDAVLKDALGQLHAVTDFIASHCKSDAGLTIRKDVRKSLKVVRKRKPDTEFSCDPLPKRPKPNPYAYRHGEKADMMKSACAVSSLDEMRKPCCN